MEKAVRTLYDYERVFNENLRLLSERFFLPLKRTGTIQGDEASLLFDIFDQLMAASKRATNSLGPAVDHEDRMPYVSEVFSGPLLEAFRAYVQQFLSAHRAWARAVACNDRLGMFLEIQRREINTSMDELLRQPLQQLAFHYETLQKILELAPKDHRLYSVLQSTASHWASIFEDQLRLKDALENDNKLADIEAAFPHATLNLMLPLDDADADDKSKRAHLRKRFSSPGGIFKRRGRRSNSHQGFDTGWSRFFVRDGPCLGVKTERTPRHLFLVSDMLIVGKHKSLNHYSLKARVKLKHAWLVDEPPVSGGDREAGRACLLVGSPAHRSLVFQFASAAEKDTWFQDLNKYIVDAKAMLDQTEGATSRISALPLFPGHMPKSEVELGILYVDIKSDTTVKALITAMLQQLKLDNHEAKHYVLYERTRKGLVKLKEYECPLPIARCGMRSKLHDGTCSFILRHIMSPELTDDDLPASLRVFKSLKRGIEPNAQKGQGHQQGHKHKHKRRHGKHKYPGSLPRKGSGTSLFKKMSDALKRTGKSTPRSKYEQQIEAAKKKGALYGQPLDATFINGEPHPAVVAMLQVLYFRGPQTMGVFRRNAHAKLVKNVRESLDKGDEVNVAELPLLVVASAFKEYLRSLPNCLIMPALYDGLRHALTHEDVDRCASELHTVLASNLTDHHMYLLRAVIGMLAKVAQNSEHNQMTSSNLSVCIGPSMLWPRRAEDVLKNDVPQIIEFMVDHPTKVLGTVDLPIYDAARKLMLFGEENDEFDDDDDDDDDDEDDEDDDDDVRGMDDDDDDDDDEDDDDSGNPLRPSDYRESPLRAVDSVDDRMRDLSYSASETPGLPSGHGAVSSSRLRSTQSECGTASTRDEPQDSPTESKAHAFHGQGSSDGDGSGDGVGGDEPAPVVPVRRRRRETTEPSSSSRGSGVHPSTSAPSATIARAIETEFNIDI
ncbi:hypothetical protein PTSG_04599 [Salpingoeca rosetta]|uniref:Rho-GAP domain-containing protein n=1 Tax=Salpingoeca rosetta (strain ATCC 50818 / BSB-021) TaxID=946362 RepID=F2U7W5_SALR5|nr:uncharacterized protein PTSG_04599 [Salpingoeca rosetta]EGD72870.1 hypothetical protein PTSG_04599 [Salpingoeca rosetta]|eukprot:XP_004994693.1 hypothetical protein PTSG_04599 [Salpingoeca rosetta]